MSPCSQRPGREGIGPHCSTPAPPLHRALLPWSGPSGTPMPEWSPSFLWKLFLSASVCALLPPCPASPLCSSSPLPPVRGLPKARGGFLASSFSSWQCRTQQRAHAVGLLRCMHWGSGLWGASKPLSVSSQMLFSVCETTAYKSRARSGEAWVLEWPGPGPGSRSSWHGAGRWQVEEARFP